MLARLAPASVALTWDASSPATDPRQNGSPSWRGVFAASRVGNLRVSVDVRNAPQSHLASHSVAPLHRRIPGRNKTRRTARHYGSLACPQEVAERAESRTERQSTADLLLSCTTFNILAPIYKRLGREELRESSYRDAWLPRNREILKTLLAKRSSIICLQELWLANPELVALYEDTLDEAGYEVIKLSRPNNRGDGLLSAVRRDRLEVVHHENLHFNDCGDKVAQILRLRARPEEERPPGVTRITGGQPMELLVVNTHLMFPHDASSSFIRLRQVYKVLEHLEAYKARQGLGQVPIILCGDLNGTKRGQVYRFLRSQGFASSYDIAHDYPDFDERWVSHRNHHGVACGVDFIWLLNPRVHAAPLAADWKAAVFEYLRGKLEDIGCGDERKAYDFFCSASDDEGDEGPGGDEGWVPRPSDEAGTPRDERAGGFSEDDDDAEGCCVITMDVFETAVSQLGREMLLSKAELRELMDSADSDKNGVVDYQEFRSVVHHQNVARNISQRADCPPDSTMPPQGAMPAVGFEVRGATLYPPETERGVWPQDYSLSDHAVLTAVFSPVPLEDAAPRS